MTKDEVIKYVIDKQLIPKLATTFSSLLGGNKDDFIQEMYMILLTEIPDSKLIKLYEDKHLDYYILSIARNQVVNDKSTFNRIYNYNRKINTIPIEDYITDEDNESI